MLIGKLNNILRNISLKLKFVGHFNTKKNPKCLWKNIYIPSNTDAMKVMLSMSKSHINYGCEDWTVDSYENKYDSLFKAHTVSIMPLLTIYITT